MKKHNLLLFSIAGVCILFTIVYYVLHSWLPSYIVGKLENFAKTELGPEQLDLYQIEVENFTFSTFFKTIYISNIKISPKEDIFHEVNFALLPGLIIETEIQNLTLPTRTLMSLVLKKQRSRIRDFRADSILFTLYTNDSSLISPDTLQKVNNSLLQVEDFFSLRMSFKQVNLADSTSSAFQSGLFNFSGELYFRERNHGCYLNYSIFIRSMRMSDINYFYSNALYNLHIDSINIDNKEQIVDLYGFSQVPILSKTDFKKQVKFITNRFDTTIKHINITGFQQNRFFKEGAIVCSKIEITHGRIGVFRDRNNPFDHRRRPKMPVQLIQQSIYDLYIGEVIFNNVDIIYEELPENAPLEGKIDFKNLDGNIKNISNIKDSLDRDSIMFVSADAFVFGKSKLHAEFKYSLTDPNGSYQAKGNLAPLSFTSINSVLYPLAGVKILSGTHHYSSFYFSGNDFRSGGEVRIQYSDLEIELLPDKKKILKGVARFLGKNALYHQNNLKDKGELRIGKINFERDKTRFVFHYWAHSFMSGVKDSVMQNYF